MAAERHAQNATGTSAGVQTRRRFAAAFQTIRVSNAIERDQTARRALLPRLKAANARSMLDNIRIMVDSILPFGFKVDGTIDSDLLGEPRN
jgi:hypothetical protein